MAGRGMTKKLYETGVAHPAPFSSSLIPVLAKVLLRHIKTRSRRLEILDPFAGVGRIHELRDIEPERFETTGVEIEPEWAKLSPFTLEGDALQLHALFRNRRFDAIVTSPTYGNRMADHHKAKDASVRRSYTHDLGRDLHPNNSGSLHWGEKYRDFHEKAWLEVTKVLRPDGLFVLNCKDHIRRGERQYVCRWHLATLRNLGFKRLESIPVGTPSMRAGENRELRLTEYIYVLR